MYIVQFEDGSFMKIKKASDSLKRECDKGYCAIIDITDPKNPKEYYENNWSEISEYDRIEN